MKKEQTLAICLCLIISCSIFIFGAGASSSTVSVLGNSAVGTYRDQNDPNAQSISYFKATTTGSVTDIVAYISGASSGKAMAALYAVNGKTPSALITQSGVVNIGKTFSWIDFKLPKSCVVSSGTTYGLAIMGNVAVNIAVVGGTGQRTGGSGYGSFAKGFTNPFGTVWFNDLTGAMSIYATGTTSSTPTATPTPTPTQTSTPTPTATPTPTQTPTPSTVSVFGNSAVGTYRDQNDPNAQSISYFKASTTGSVTDIVAYISGASSGKALAALFAVNGNTPSTLIAQSSSVNIGTSFSWVDFQLSTSYTVSSGTTYGLAVMGNVPVNIAIVSGTGQRTGGSGYGSFAKGFTNPFGTVWFNDLTGAMSIYATGTTSSTPTATPTPTPTQTSTPTPTATPTPTQAPLPPPAPPSAPIGNNLAILPSFFQNPNDPNYGVPNAIGGNPYILYPVSYAQRSNLIEMVPYLGYAGGGSLGRCELDGSWVSVKPGDHIIWTAELYVTDSTVGDTNPWNGGLIGMDAYGSEGRICEIGDSAGLGTYPNNPPDQIDRTIPWGSKTWTTFTYDFIVPKTYVADYSSSYVVGSNVVPVAFIPWFCIWSGVGGTNSPPLEGGRIYISNPEFYIISS